MKNAALACGVLGLLIVSGGAVYNVVRAAQLAKLIAERAPQAKASGDGDLYRDLETNRKCVEARKRFFDLCIKGHERDTIECEVMWATIGARPWASDPTMYIGERLDCTEPDRRY